MDCVAPLSKGGRRNLSVTSRCFSPLLLLTCALLMTSPHSEGRDQFGEYKVEFEGDNQRGDLMSIEENTLEVLPPLEAKGKMGKKTLRKKAAGTGRTTAKARTKPGQISRRRRGGKSKMMDIQGDDGDDSDAGDGAGAASAADGVLDAGDATFLGAAAAAFDRGAGVDGDDKDDQMMQAALAESMAESMQMDGDIEDDAARETDDGLAARATLARSGAKRTAQNSSATMETAHSSDDEAGHAADSSGPASDPASAPAPAAVDSDDDGSDDADAGADARNDDSSGSAKGNAKRAAGRRSAASEAAAAAVAGSAGGVADELPFILSDSDPLPGRESEEEGTDIGGGGGAKAPTTQMPTLPTVLAPEITVTRMFQEDEINRALHAAAKLVVCKEYEPDIAQWNKEGPAMAGFGWLVEVHTSFTLPAT